MIRDDHPKGFIRAVRKALGKPPDGGTPPALFHIPPDDPEARRASYRERTPQRQQAMLSELKDRAGAVNMHLSVVPDASTAGDAIRNLVLSKSPEWDAAKRIVAWDHPLIEELHLEDRLANDKVPVTVTRLGDGKDTPEERLRLRQAVEAAFVGITSADFVVAHTATMVMRSHAGHLRSVSLVPSIHVCVVHAARLVADLGELYFRLLWDPEEKRRGLTNCMTFISAPSKTGDIELVMVNGAHGPREVHLVLISG